jgi:hypothetical protein
VARLERHVTPIEHRLCDGDAVGIERQGVPGKQLLLADVNGLRLQAHPLLCL